jgi:hypothetical protein
MIGDSLQFVGVFDLAYLVGHGTANVFARRNC